jgi:glycerol 2-dehydrogenase (NADP+)
MGRQGEGPHVVNMVKAALKLGYRHIDTASFHESSRVEENNDMSGDW